MAARRTGSTALIDVEQWRGRLGRLGVWAPTDAMGTAEADELAVLLEELGYGVLWVPETTGRDPFTHIAHMATGAERLVFATGIANIHHRHPGPMRQAADTLAEMTGGRFVLGIGVSHAPLVEGIRGLDYSKPVATMRKYLQAMDASPFVAPAPTEPAPRLVGALGPKMLALSAELADGAHPYWTTPEHTASAREVLGPDKLLCVEQKVVCTTDAEVARHTARRSLSIYVGLPNYRNNWLRLGFTEAEVDEMADRFVDAVVAWGEPEVVRERLDAHLAAGADHVCIQAMVPGRAFRVDTEALRALAP